MKNLTPYSEIPCWI